MQVKPVFSEPSLLWGMFEVDIKVSMERSLNYTMCKQVILFVVSYVQKDYFAEYYRSLAKQLYK